MNKKVVWKYSLLMLNGTYIDVDLPVGAKILCVHEQNDRPTMWVEVDPDAEQMESRTLRVVGTGHPIPEDCVYVGTAFCGDYVWHIYE